MCTCAFLGGEKSHRFGPVIEEALDQRKVNKHWWQIDAGPVCMRKTRWQTNASDCTSCPLTRTCGCYSGPAQRPRIPPASWNLTPLRGDAFKGTTPHRACSLPKSREWPQAAISDHKPRAGWEQGVRGYWPQPGLHSRAGFHSTNHYRVCPEGGKRDDVF